MGDGGLFNISLEHLRMLRPETLQRMLEHCLEDKAVLAACFGLQRLRDVPRGVEWYMPRTPLLDVELDHMLSTPLGESSSGGGLFPRPDLSA